MGRKGSRDRERPGSSAVNLHQGQEGQQHTCRLLSTTPMPPSSSASCTRTRHVFQKVLTNIDQCTKGDTRQRGESGQNLFSRPDPCRIATGPTTQQHCTLPTLSTGPSRPCNRMQQHSLSPPQHWQHFLSPDGTRAHTAISCCALERKRARMLQDIPGFELATTRKGHTPRCCKQCGEMHSTLRLS